MVNNILFNLNSIHQKYWKDFCDGCYSRFGFEQGEKRSYQQKYETFCHCKSFIMSEDGYEEQLLLTKEEDLQRLCDTLNIFYNLRDVVHFIPMLLTIHSMVSTLCESIDADRELIKRICPRHYSINYKEFLGNFQRTPKYRNDLINDTRLKDLEEGWLKEIIFKLDIPPFVDEVYLVSDAVIIRKTKCSHFFERNVLFSKTKRIFG